MILYALREVQLIKAGNKYIVAVNEEPEKTAKFDNPLLAWAHFVDLIDVRVRRRIGDMLEKEKKNRYTGENRGD